MRFALKAAFAGAVMTLIAGCGTINGNLIADMENMGDEFAGHLRDGYVDLGRTEAAKDDMDWSDSDHFYKKALAAASGETVLPDEVSSRKIPADHVVEMTSARERLMTGLDGGGRTKAAEPMARAQVMYDCWLEEQEENHEPDNIAACKKGFEDAMAEVEKVLKPMVMAKPAPKPAPPPAPIVDGLYLVFFDWDDARPNTESGSVILKVLEDYKIDNPAHVHLTGHADRSGSAEYNLDLSRRRAENMKAILTEAGIPADKIVVDFAGETKPLRPTDDGVREARNRRVEIEFE